jgi:hypothetical protein
MINFIGKYWSSALTLVIGVVFAAAVTPVVLMTAEWYTEWYAARNPPATIEFATIERVHEDTVRFTLQVTRHEDECEMLRLSAFTGDALNLMRPAKSVDREDGGPPQTFMVGIQATSKPWLLRGVYGNRIAISLKYGCGNHLAVTPLLFGVIPPVSPAQ